MQLTPAEAALNMQLTPLDADLHTYGFPAGYFVIRSVATNRLLDVDSDDVEDGTNIILWPEKDSSLVESKSSYAHRQSVVKSSAAELTLECKR